MRKLDLSETQRKARRRQQQLKAMAKKPEHYRELVRFHYRKNWIKEAFWRARSRAARLKMEFSLTLEDMPPMPTFCSVLGLRLEPGRNSNGGPNDASPSLDRIHQDKGYIPGNVRIISYRANTLKANATINELKAVLEDMIDTAPKV